MKIPALAAVLMVLLSACIASAEIVAVSPAEGETVKLLPPCQRSVLVKETMAERVALFEQDKANGCREFGRDRPWRKYLPMTFKWRATAGETGPWHFWISKNRDFSNARIEAKRTLSTNAMGIACLTLPRPNLEIGETYWWRISAEGVTNAPSSFLTEDLAPRWIAIEGRVGNIRDLGGRIAADGRRVRQGMIFRGQCLNDSSEDGRVPGRNRLMVEDITYLTGTLGIRTELDLRSAGETAGMTVSPLGSSVRYVRIGTSAYKGLFNGGGYGIAQAFRIFCDEKNYPIYFHCFAGADRTGGLAYVLNGVLGVSRREIETDWESTFYPGVPDRRPDGSRSWDSENHFNDGFEKYGEPGDSWNRRIELYLLAHGVTKDEIDHFRAIMLKDRR